MYCHLCRTTACVAMQQVQLPTGFAVILSLSIEDVINVKYFISTHMIRISHVAAMPYIKKLKPKLSQQFQDRLRCRLRRYFRCFKCYSDDSCYPLRRYLLGYLFYQFTIKMNNKRLRRANVTTKVSLLLITLHLSTYHCDLYFLETSFYCSS